MNTKYILSRENQKPMIFNVFDCAKLYQVIYGGVIFKMDSGDFEKVI